MTALSRLWSRSVQKYQQPGFVICAGTWPGILWPSNAVWPASVVGGAPEAGLPTGLHWAHLLRVLLQSKGHLQLTCTLHGQERGHDPSAKSGKTAYQENTFMFPLLLQEALNSDMCTGWVMPLSYTRVHQRNDLPHHFSLSSAGGILISGLDCQQATPLVHSSESQGAAEALCFESPGRWCWTRHIIGGTRVTWNKNTPLCKTIAQHLYS